MHKAQFYALLYGDTNPDIQRAGLLRAQAAALRDAGGANADWPKVEALLVDSYTSLHAGIQGARWESCVNRREHTELKDSGKSTWTH